MNRLRNILTGAVTVAALLVATAGAAQAQEGVITGQVTNSQTLQPITGAQVVVEGTGLSDVTNQDGRYRIAGVPAGEVTLRVIRVGFATEPQTITLEPGETAVVDIQIDPTAVTLDELVVTAVGQQRVREVGTSITRIDADAVVEKASPKRLSDLLQAQATGLQLQMSSGTVGTGAAITIRGITSIGLDNTPLIIVDGIRINNDNDITGGVGGQQYSRLNDLNPDNIKSIRVIKGPAAAALYGTAAGAGVIIIETKTGQVTGDARWVFNTELGYNVEDTDFPETAWTPTAFGLPRDTVYTIDLLDAPATNPFREGLIQSYSLSVSGGQEGLTYYLSGEYRDEEGTLVTNRVESYNFRANATYSPSDEIDISLSTAYNSSITLLPENDNNAFGYIGVSQLGFAWQEQFMRTDPDIAEGGEPVETCALAYEVDFIPGTVAPLAVYSQAFCADNAFFVGRPFTAINDLVNERRSERFIGSVQMTWRPTDNWTNAFTAGYDFISEQYDGLFPVDPERPFGNLSRGFKYAQTLQNRSLTLSVRSTYNWDITDALTSTTTLGGEFFKQVGKGSTCVGRVLPAGSIICGDALFVEGGSFYGEERTAGVFLSEQLGWQNRFFINPAVRVDDNAAFGENLGYAVYPSIQTAYVLSETDWFPDFFQQFKIRAAYGQSGLQPPALAAQVVFGVVKAAVRGEDRLGVRPTDPGNPQLKPETVEEYEVGFDARMFNGRVGLNVTYFNKHTFNALVFEPLAPSLGFPGTRPSNVGEVLNTGIEVSLDATAVRTDNFTWNLNLGVSTVENEVLELKDPIVFGLGGASQRIKEGFPIGAYFTEELVKVTRDTVIYADSVTYVGEPGPDVSGGLSTTFNLFDTVTIYALLDYAFGQQLYNATQEFRCGFLFGICTAIYERDPDGTLTKEARIKRAAEPATSIDPWVEDASYAKLRTVTVSFSIPEDWVAAFGASGAELSFTGQNLYTFTEYDGLDPEINFAGQLASYRASFLTLPHHRRFVTAISLRF